MIMKLIKNAVNSVIKFYGWLTSPHESKISGWEESPLRSGHGGVEKTETYTIFLKDCKKMTPYQIMKEENIAYRDQLKKLKIESTELKQEFQTLLEHIKEGNGHIPSQVRP